VTAFEAPEIWTYQLRAVLRGISPMIWRRLLVRSDSTIAQLRDALQVGFGWDDMQLHAESTTPTLSASTCRYYRTADTFRSGLQLNVMESASS